MSSLDDLHVNGEYCWCSPAVELVQTVDGGVRQLIIHNKDIDLDVEAWKDLYYKMEIELIIHDQMLREWYAWFYSPSRAIQRQAPYLAWAISSGFQKGVRDGLHRVAQARLSRGSDGGSGSVDEGERSGSS